VLRAANWVLDLVMPPQCLNCRGQVAAQGGLCPTCWNEIHFLAQPCCVRCGHPFADQAQTGLTCGACLRDPPGFDRARAAFSYDAASKGLVLSFKHADRPGMARAFAPWMAQAARDLLADADLLVPVPLHPLRLLHRRYNQAALLAQELGRHSKASYCPDLLRRQRRTAPQGSMSRSERLRNIKGAFALGGQADRAAGRRLVLVDDVLTTGATIGACTELLRAAGATRVDVVTLARVVFPQ
jgi:ComF family protein